MGALLSYCRIVLFFYCLCVSLSYPLICCFIRFFYGGFVCLLSFVFLIRYLMSLSHRLISLSFVLSYFIFILSFLFFLICYLFFVFRLIGLSFVLSPIFCLCLLVLSANCPSYLWHLCCPLWPLVRSCRGKWGGGGGGHAGGSWCWRSVVSLLHRLIALLSCGLIVAFSSSPTP